MTTLRKQPGRFFLNRGLSDSGNLLQSTQKSFMRSQSESSKFNEANMRRLSIDLFLKGLPQKLDAESEKSAISYIKKIYASDEKLNQDQQEALIDILELAIEINLYKLTELLLTLGIRPRDAQDALLTATAKGYTHLFKLLVDHGVILSDQENLDLLLRNIRSPQMVFLLQECGIDFNKNGTGKAIIQDQLTIFWTFYSLHNMVNQDQFDTIMALMKCGTKIAETDLPILEKWPEDVLPRKRDILFSQLNRIKKELEEEKELQEKAVPTNSFRASF